MTSFITWYLTLTLLGLITFPLAHFLFPALTDKGYALARSLGLLIWGYLFWMLASLGILQNNFGGAFFALALVVGLSIWAYFKQTASALGWMRANTRYIVMVELIFFIIFLAWTIVRAANPEAAGTEKPMEMAFINAILRSPTFPPHDPWLSGYAISYYYFGYVMTALIAKFTATSGLVAFNLMSALIFALGVIGAYGILYNLLSAYHQKMQTPETEEKKSARKTKTTTTKRKTKKEETSARASASGLRSLVFALFAPLFMLIAGNIEGFLEALHRAGYFWKFNSDGTATSAFWAWLNLKDLINTPQQPFQFTPDRFWWWWRASRVVQDYDLAGNWVEVIDEFPFFSFLLGDLHPHVLAIPFVLLAVAVALNIFNGGWRGTTRFLDFEISISAHAFFFSALVLGGLAFLNTWDFPIYLALLVGAYMLSLPRESWTWADLAEFFVFALLIAFASVLLYLPFYIGFSSQAGGILPNIVFPTRGTHLWLMFASLFTPILIYFVYTAYREKQKFNWTFGALASLGFILFLWAFSWALSSLLQSRAPELAAQFLQSQNVASMAELFTTSTLRRLSYGFSLVTLGILLAFAFAYLSKSNRASLVDAHSTRMTTFIFLLALVAVLLILAPEFVYLRDQFSTRMNTIFKFYYQGWILLSIAAGFGSAVLIEKLRGTKFFAFTLGLILLLLMALAYPYFGVPAKMGLAERDGKHQPFFGWTLNGMAHVEYSYPDDAAAIHWLEDAPLGVVAEAVGGSYSDFARAATFSGQPNVIGWPGHEGQWRGGYEEQGTRINDMKILFETNNWQEALALIQKYNIRYVFVGTLERSAYALNERKFQDNLKEVFRSGDVVIYTLP